MSELPPIEDPAAEAAVLAAVLTEPRYAPQLLDLDTDAFYAPLHQVVHQTINRLTRDGIAVDPGIVMTKAAKAGTHQADSVKRLVLSLYGKGNPGALTFYVDRLRELATARRLVTAAQQLESQTREAVNVGEPTYLTEALLNARLALDDANTDTTPNAEDMPMSLTDLLDLKHEEDWLIPGLLERTDRFVLTGLEGLGKSFISSQFALTITCGLHPFLGSPVSAGHRVLVIDAENSAKQTARRYQKIRAMVNKLCENQNHPPIDNDRLRFVIRPEGIPLNDPRELGRIERAIAAHQPEFVTMGPMYRLAKLDIKEEQEAKMLTDAIDRLRVKYQFSVLIESHTPHGSPGMQRQLRPVGSSLFLRWPEFGLGIRPAADAAAKEHPDLVDLVAWRGGREEREWPSKLAHSHRLPWVPDSAYYQRARELGRM